MTAGFPVGPSGKCAVCGTTVDLTRHHLFGRGLPFTLRLCLTCHRGYHREADTRKPGRFMAAVTLAAAFAFGHKFRQGYPKDQHAPKRKKKRPPNV